MRSQPVALLGEAPPRVLVKPKGARANSWQDVADISAAFGLALDPWQEVILEAAMGERSDRTWAAKRVGVSVPRQNGKSQLLVARAVAGALLFGEKKIVVSAHQQDTARESFAKLMELIEADANAALRDRVKSVMNALNRESVKFTNGAQIQFKSRSGAGSKGFSSDCLLLDEAQILGSRAWTSINSTMSAMPNPQVWLLGTPPQEEDDCYTFEVVRRSALDGKSTAAAWCEWSADPHSPDYDPASEFTRWSANPAWNSRINHEVVQGEFETYSPDRFSQDRLGIWRELGSHEQPIPLDAWKRLEVAEAPTADPSRFAVSMTPERVASIAVSIGGDVSYLDIAELSRVDDSRLVIDWLVTRCGRRIPVMIDSRDPAASLVPELKSRGVKVNVTGQQDATRACGGLLDAVTEGRTSHCGQPALTSALRVATKKLVGKAGLWEWNPEDPSTEAACLRAMTLAHFGLSLSKPKTGRVVTA